MALEGEMGGNLVKHRIISLCPHCLNTGMRESLMNSFTFVNSQHCTLSQMRHIKLRLNKELVKCPMFSDY